MTFLDIDFVQSQFLVWKQTRAINRRKFSRFVELNLFKFTREKRKFLTHFSIFSFKKSSVFSALFNFFFKFAIVGLFRSFWEMLFINCSWVCLWRELQTQTKFSCTLRNSVHRLDLIQEFCFFFLQLFIFWIQNF